MSEITESSGTTPPGSNRLFVAGVVVVFVLVVAGVAAFVAGASSNGPERVQGSPHAAVAPLDLSTVSADMAAHYRFAKAHLDDFAEIPCWCGCQQFLGHRSLADCWVRADGKGWEAHAAGCAVCTGEAVTAERMLGEGKTAADVRAAVDAQYGRSAITVPPAGT